MTTGADALPEGAVPAPMPTAPGEGDAALARALRAVAEEVERAGIPPHLEALALRLGRALEARRKPADLPPDPPRVAQETPSGR